MRPTDGLAELRHDAGFTCSMYTFFLRPITMEGGILYWPKRDPQIILGFFDPDPVLLAKQGGGAND